jgi:hypothetical protein
MTFDELTLKAMSIPPRLVRLHHMDAPSFVLALACCAGSCFAFIRAARATVIPDPRRLERSRPSARYL